MYSERLRVRNIHRNERALRSIGYHTVTLRSGQVTGVASLLFPLEISAYSGVCYRTKTHFLCPFRVHPSHCLQNKMEMFVYVHVFSRIMERPNIFEVLNVAEAQDALTVLY